MVAVFAQDDKAVQLIQEQVEARPNNAYPCTTKQNNTVNIIRIGYVGHSRIAQFSLYAICRYVLRSLINIRKDGLYCIALHMVCPLFAHFNVTMTTNSGIAFSWFAHSTAVWRTMLLVFSMLIVCCLSVYQWFYKCSTMGAYRCCTYHRWRTQ